MPFLIDTNIFIYARDDRFGVLDKIDEHDGDIFLSAVSLAELQRGLVEHHPDAKLRESRHQILIDRIEVAPFDATAARAYRAIVGAKGRMKARDLDHLIAAHAIALGFVLATNNLADFTGIPGLSVENWASPPGR